VLYDFFRDSPLAFWPLAAFGLFFTVFVGVCVYLVVGAVKKKDLSHLAALPLEGDAPRTAEGENHPS